MSSRDNNIRADQELLDRIFKGDKEAIETFFNTYKGLIFGVIRKSQFDQSSAEDVFGDFFARLLEDDWRRLRSWNRESKLSTFLISILKNQIIDEIRKRKRRPTETLDDANAPAITPIEEVEKGMDLATLKKQLTECRTKLTERDQQIYQRRFIDDISAPEIAKELGITVNAAHQAIHNTKNRLIRCMREEYPVFFNDSVKSA